MRDQNVTPQVYRAENVSNVSASFEYLCSSDIADGLYIAMFKMPPADADIDKKLRLLDLLTSNMTFTINRLTTLKV